MKFKINRLLRPTGTSSCLRGGNLLISFLLKSFPRVSPSAAGKFSDEGRRADGGLRNGELFT